MQIIYKNQTMKKVIVLDMTLTLSNRMVSIITILTNFDVSVMCNK